MIRRCALVTSLAWSTALGAQARVDPVTLGDAMRSLTVAAQVGKMNVKRPLAQHTLDSLTGAFAESRLTQIPIEQAARALQPNAKGGPLVTARAINREQVETRTRAFRDGVLRLNGIGNAEVMSSLQSEAVTEDSISKLLAPFDALVAATRAAARARNQDALARFERKYGPDSPRLNYLEVGLNYAAQFVPGFKSTESGGPSPLEIIASYNSLSLKLNDSTSATANMVSTGRLGVRIYFFGEAWGQEGRIMHLLRPAHASLGLMSMGPQDDPLQRVWGRGYRLGPFVAWGDLFAGYVGGSNHGLVVGTNQFIIPRVF